MTLPLRIEFESGVPMPPMLRHNKYDWGSMKVGDSRHLFAAGPYDAELCRKRMLVSALNWAKRNRPGWRFESRLDESREGARVWRME